MTTLQEYLNKKYPTKKEKEQVKEIKVGYSTEKETKELDGGELNLSEYPNLEKVIINGDYLKTKLTSLEVSNCSQLTFLDVYDNELTHLDLNNCAKLKELYCEKNSLTKLDLNPQIKLKELIINSNNFSEPDLSFLKLIKKGFSGREVKEWTEIGLQLTEVKEWSESFDCEECKKWLNIGFTPQDGYFCVWLRNIKQLTLEQAKSNEQQLRGEFNNVSLITKQWLEKYYPSKETRSMYINQQLEGILDCSEYKNLWEMCISTQVDKSKFKIIKGSYKNIIGGVIYKISETQIIPCISAQTWLEQNYPKNGTCLRKNEKNWSSENDDFINNHGKTREQITRLDISSSYPNYYNMQNDFLFSLLGKLLCNLVSLKSR